MPPKSLIFMTLAALTPASPALAAQASECPAPEAATVPVPAEWQGWDAPRPLPADGPIVPGIAYDFALAPVAQVPLSGFHGEDLPDGSRGAIVTFTAPRAGIYRITVADPMWIDVIGPDGVIESVGHGHGPDCSGIGKIVDFELEAGSWLIELSAAEVAQSRLMIEAPH